LLTVAAPLVDGILFDIDDTLVDTRNAFAVALGAVRQSFLPHLGVEREAEMLAMWRNDAAGHYRAYTDGLISDEEQRRRRADELHAAFGGPPVDEAFYPDWNAVFWGTFTRSWTAHADVAAVLTVLTAAGVPIGSVTNARHVLQTAKLAAAGIAGVPVLVGVDTFGFGKPDPRVFHEGCRLLGTSPARTAYVGDEPDVDAMGAMQAGLVGVWLDRPGERRERTAGSLELGGVHRITGLAALPALLGLG
jgi:putative hydrolase of the HAD superfamily